MAITKILLCGKRCTGKTTLFWDLQKTLGWPIFSVSEYLREYIHRHALTPEEVEDRSEELSTDYENRVMTIVNSPDRVIIDSRVFGRMAELGPDVLKILLTADDAKRIERAAYRQQTPVEKQRIKLLKNESQWIKRMETLYPGVDFFDPSRYDLALDTTDKTPEAVLAAVLAKLGILPPHSSAWHAEIPEENILFQGSST
jgi:cytidylate kinase